MVHEEGGATTLLQGKAASRGLRPSADRSVGVGKTAMTIRFVTSHFYDQ